MIYLLIIAGCCAAFLLLGWLDRYFWPDIDVYSKVVEEEDR